MARKKGVAIHPGIAAVRRQNRVPRNVLILSRNIAWHAKTGSVSDMSRRGENQPSTHPRGSSTGRRGENRAPAHPDGGKVRRRGENRPLGHPGGGECGWVRGRSPVKPGMTKVKPGMTGGVGLPVWPDGRTGLRRRLSRSRIRPAGSGRREAGSEDGRRDGGAVPPPTEKESGGVPEKSPPRQRKQKVAGCGFFCYFCRR